MNKQMSVLVIDDERMIREILQSALSKKNFVVHTAEDGPTGIALAQQKDVSVILLDWMMPDMNGLEVVRRLKQNDNTRHTPVFMLTSKDAGNDIAQAMAAGADDYIVKPFNISEVGDMVVDRLKKVKNYEMPKKKFHFADIFSKKS